MAPWFGVGVVERILPPHVAGRSRQKKCRWCRPVRNQKDEITGYGHKLAMISVVGTGLSLPFDVEPYGPGDSEYSAGQRLLRRAVR